MIPTFKRRPDIEADVVEISRKINSLKKFLPAPGSLTLTSEDRAQILLNFKPDQLAQIVHEGLSRANYSSSSISYLVGKPTRS